MSGKPTSNDLSQAPWLLILPFSALMLLIAWLLFHLADPGGRSWHVPLPEDLNTFSGTFEATPEYYSAPYVVRAANGDRLVLGCVPDSKIVACLKDAGISRASLTGKRVTVRYFIVPKRPFRHPNILSSLSLNGEEVLGLEERGQALRRAASLEDRRREEGNPLAVLAMLAAILAPAYLIYRKLRGAAV